MQIYLSRSVQRVLVDRNLIKVYQDILQSEYRAEKTLENLYNKTVDDESTNWGTFTHDLQMKEMLIYFILNGLRRNQSFQTTE